MFEIFGFFSEEEKHHKERILSNLTAHWEEGDFNVYRKGIADGKIYDFTGCFENFQDNLKFLTNDEKNIHLILPPFKSIVQLYAPYSGKLLISLRCKRHGFREHSPFISINDMEEILNTLSPFKEKILIELSGECIDYSLLNNEKNSLTYDQAIMLCFKKACNIYDDPNTQCPYFTYREHTNAPHLVWVENMDSIAKKHNLIKSQGYGGIFWKSPFRTSLGNWEALSTIYKKRH